MQRSKKELNIRKLVFIILNLIEFGIFTGIIIAVFWIATSRLNDVLYERKPMALFWINTGYNFVIYILMGAILGAWN